MGVEDSEGVTFTCHVLLNWKVNSPSLMSDTCHLAYLLSPHPVVQKHVSLNMSLEDKIAAERIIFTTFIANHIVGAEKDNTKTKLCTTFWKEHGECALYFLLFYFSL